MWTAGSAYDEVCAALTKFLREQERQPILLSDKVAAYTHSATYLASTIEFHAGEVCPFLDCIQGMMGPNDTVVDVGCATGITGLTFAFYGHHVTFHDYEGLGLEFIRWFIQEHSLNARVVPYGEPVGHQDWAIALDVIEHTGNHWGCLRWLKELGDTVALTHPHALYKPPYVPAWDEWIDDEALMWTIRRRHEVLYEYGDIGRRFVIFK